MIFRATDIETLADLSAYTPPDTTYQLVGGLPLKHYGEDENGPFHEPLLQRKDVIPPVYACRVVSISYVDVHFDPAHEPRYWYDKCYTKCLWSPGDDLAEADRLERELLTDFHEAMSVGGVEGTLLNLVTWNGRSFDLPVIMMRSLKHRIPCKWYYSNRNMRYRYSDEGHCDLMDSLADYGAARFMKLGDVARLVGLPGKTDMSGDKVADLYAESCRDPGKSDVLRAKTARYCLQDSIQTALVWLITRHHYGKAVRDTINAGIETFRSSPEICEAIDVNWEGVLL